MSTFLFFLYLDGPWEHTVWYYSIPATMKKKKFNLKNSIIIHVITILNIVYDCKHLIVLIIGEWLGTISKTSLVFNNRSLLTVING